MVLAIVCSVCLVIIGRFEPVPLHDMNELVGRIDFTNLLMSGMLYFLLFAGAIQINLDDLKEEKMPIIIFSSISIIISTFVVGFLLYYVLAFLFPLIGIHFPVSPIYCFLFGAIISPTDPIAVLVILKKTTISKSLETKITGEALFNDGMAIILFTVIYSIAQGQEQLKDISFLSITWLLVKEAFGALIIGMILGYIGFLAIKKVNDYKFTVLVTLSAVMGAYMISQALGISGPLTMVSAGIIIGNESRKYSAQKRTDIDFVKNFWELIDEVLNTILFLLMGFELLLLPDLSKYWASGLAAILIVLIARYMSVRIPAFALKGDYSPKTIFILVWGGVRGGVSIALALSIGDVLHRGFIVSITYFVVVFSIIVQGLSLKKLVNRL
jgi:CPA1 family monovalent cation:H+ antiporter